jgi:hypothetical protein
MPACSVVVLAGPKSPAKRVGTGVRHRRVLAGDHSEGSDHLRRIGDDVGEGEI